MDVRSGDAWAEEVGEDSATDDFFRTDLRRFTGGESVVDIARVRVCAIPVISTQHIEGGVSCQCVGTAVDCMQTTLDPCK